MVAGRVLSNTFCLSLCSAVCPGVFLELGHYISLNFDMVLETLMKLCDSVGCFRKTFFAQKFWEMGKKIDQEYQGFFHFFFKLVINIHRICSIVKVYIICCVSAKILYLEKPCFWYEGQMLSAKQIAWFLNQLFLEKQIDEAASFFACWYKLIKIKIRSNYFWLGMVKNGYGQSSLWTLKLTVSQEWTDGINWFFACWYKFM